MDEEIIKIIGVLIISMIIIYFFIHGFKTNITEGLTNNNKLDFGNGEGASSSTYAANIKSKVIQLQDELLINKYRKDYENVIINMDDYVSYLMLKTVLNMNIEGNDMKNNLMTLNTLKQTKDSLNETMKVLDRF
jgi:hypothetical protein